ncbi:MAG: hypothetical protein QXJ17_00690 [Nitrososphaeria archaeon]
MSFKLHGEYGLMEKAIGEVMASTFKRFEFELHREKTVETIERGAFTIVDNGAYYVVGVVTDTKLVIAGSSTRPSRLKIAPTEIDHALPDLKDRTYNSYDATIVGEFVQGRYLQADHLHHALVHAQVYSMDVEDIREFLGQPCDYLHLLYENGGVDCVLSHLIYLKNVLNHSELAQFLSGVVRMLHIRGFDELSLMVVSLIE